MDEIVAINHRTTGELQNINSYNNIKITEDELRKVINSFKHRAPGKDGITKHHLVNLPPNMIKNLNNIINSTINLGHIPAAWKESIMVMLPKPGKSPRQVENYRPISLLNLPSKVLEKIVNTRLLAFIDENGLVSKEQHGFRRGMGTDTATAVIYESIAAGRANRCSINVVCRDIKGAFDKVWTTGLVGKLIIHKFPDYLIRLLYNYLHKRQASIRIGGHVGEQFELKSGVPQGGCLSPTLFNFYTHEMPVAERDNVHVVYADDVTQIIRYRGQSSEMLVKETERAIQSVNDFEYMWKIRTDINKFTIVPIEGRRKKNIRTRGREIEYAKEAKALGLTITGSGFSKHISNRVGLARAQLRSLFRLRNLNPKSKRLLYLAMIRSILVYPTIPLHISSNSQLNRLQTVQNKAARLITNTRLMEHKTNIETNRKAELESIRSFLDRQAKAIWEKMELGDRDWERLQFEGSSKNRYPSSRRATGVGY